MHQTRNLEVTFIALVTKRTGLNILYLKWRHIADFYIQAALILHFLDAHLKTLQSSLSIQSCLCLGTGHAVLRV